MAGPVDLTAFVAGFLLEADEHLHSANRNLVATAEALRKGLPEPRAARELFRSLHTIKGLASMVGADPIVDISHEMEGILRVTDRSAGMLTEAALDLLVRGTRAIEERVGYISKHGIHAIPAAPKPLIEALILLQNVQPTNPRETQEELDLPPEILKVLALSDREQIVQALESDKRVILLDFQPSPANAAAGLNITSVRERLGRVGELVKVVPHASAQAPSGIAFYLLLVSGATDAELAELVGTSDALIKTLHRSPVVNAPEAPAEAIPNVDWAPMEQSSIRVDVRRLDEALERLSELVITRFKMARAITRLSARGVDTRELGAVLAENTSQLKTLREAITRARMVPLAELLQRLPLVARGLTSDSDKQVNVTIQASNAEVDKAVADKIFPAVVHLVRNSVDHAIESVEERRRLGKPDAGTLSIVCDDSSGTSLVMTLTDDGRGIDRQAVARKAGLPPARSDQELLQQIATPGLSTRSDVTHTSGRGMGVDIVKRVVEQLGGTLSLSTTEGRGTTFTLRVPVSVTIIDVFSFVSEGQVFVAPVSMIEEVMEVDASRMVKTPVTRPDGPQPKLIRRGSDAIPLFSLAALLKRQPEVALSPKALVVQNPAGAIAFGVDRLLGQQVVVVRPLDGLWAPSPGMAGATDLGDGLPTLVLDLAVLGAAVMQAEAT